MMDSEMKRLPLKKVPQIRFKGFEEEWNTCRLDEAATVERGKFSARPRNDPKYFGGNIPFVQTGDVVSANRRLRRYSQTLNEEGLVVSRSFPKDTILITIAANIGDLAIADFNVACPDSVVAINARDDFDTDFLHDFLGTRKGDLEAASTTAAQANINLKVLKPLMVVVPTLNEQAQIGGYFRELDSLIGLHQRKHDKLVTLKKAMLQKMFPQPGATTPEIRFKGFSGDWVEDKLGKLGAFSKGQGYSKSDLTTSGTPIVLYGRLYVNYQTAISSVDTFVVEKKGSVKSVGKEVIVPASGETAEDIARASAIVTEGIILGGDLNIIYPFNELDACFLALTLSNGKPQTDLAKRAQGKTVVHVRKADLESILIPFPKLAEQQKISTYFRTLDELISQHATQLQKLQQIKSACLERMMISEC